MATRVSQGLAAKLQQALVKFGFYPGLMSLTWDANTISELERYWTSKGFALPKSAAEATSLLSQSFREEGAVRDPDFTSAEETVLGLAYAEARGLDKGWFRKNWIWITLGGVVLVGGAVGGYFWWKKSKKPMGELEGLGGGLGCPCALGHSGRTSMYSFPSGKKRGHYRDATGRFHSHP